MRVRRHGSLWVPDRAPRGSWGALGLGLRRNVPPPGVWTHIQTVQQDPTACAIASGTTVAETFGTTPAVGNLVVVQIVASDGCNGDIITSVTDNQGGANTYTLIKLVVGSGAACLAYCFINAASGTFTVTANITSGCSHTQKIVISEFHSSGGSPSFDTSSSASGSGATQTAGTITPAGSGELFIDVVYTDSGGSPGDTPTAGRTKRGNGRSSDPNLSSSSLIAVDSAAKTANWTGGTSPSYVGVQAAFIP